MRGKLTVQMASTKPLQTLFDAFRHHAVEQQWAQPHTKMKFVTYDGDPMEAGKTLAAYEYEDEDQVDVKFEL
jgi:hypothetical protein